MVIFSVSSYKGIYIAELDENDEKGYTRKLGRCMIVTDPYHVSSIFT